MSKKGQLLEIKSLRAFTDKTANWNEIAKDCIAFANVSCGRLLLGIEDGQELPRPQGQATHYALSPPWADSALRQNNRFEQILNIYYTPKAGVEREYRP